MNERDPLFDARHRAIKRALAIGQSAEYVHQPPESIWQEAFAALDGFKNDGVWRADGVATTCPKTRDLGDRVLLGLQIMRDVEDDEDGWVLPDLAVIGRAINALGALVQRAEDRHRFKIALGRIGTESTDHVTRQFARSVIAGGSARAALAFQEPAFAVHDGTEPSKLVFGSTKPRDSQA